MHIKIIISIGINICLSLVWWSIRISTGKYNINISVYLNFQVLLEMDFSSGFVNNLVL